MAKNHRKFQLFEELQTLSGAEWETNADTRVSYIRKYMHGMVEMYYTMFIFQSLYITNPELTLLEKGIGTSIRTMRINTDDLMNVANFIQNTELQVLKLSSFSLQRSSS